MKGEGDKTKLPRDKTEGSMLKFEGWCASEVLPSADCRGTGMEIHTAAETQGLLKCRKSQELLRRVMQELRLLPCQRWWGRSVAMKCTYTTAQGMGSEQEELEAMVQQEISLEGPGKEGEAVR